MSPAPEGRVTRILVVDDQPFFLTMLQNILQAKGYRVLTAKNGDEGLAQAKREKPDAIVLDVEMPGKDGFTVCGLLKADPDLKEVPVIFLTATEDAKLNEKAFKAGAAFTAPKGIAGERLLNILALTLGKGKPSA